MSFTDKVVLVTGASSGIGAATAVVFAREGANVVIVGRNESKLKQVEEQCKQNGNAPLAIIADVALEEDLRRIFDSTIDKYGKLDVLVNNAGMAALGTITEGTLVDAFNKMMPINIGAVMRLTTMTAPYLAKTKGNIVNVSSITGKKNLQMHSFLPYNVTKAALDHFTRGAALELATTGVRVNSVSPGPVKTDFMVNADVPLSFDDIGATMPLKRASAPEEIADLILYLASDKARGITGSDFITDNGSLLL